MKIFKKCKENILNSLITINGNNKDWICIDINLKLIDFGFCFEDSSEGNKKGQVWINCLSIFPIVTIKFNTDVDRNSSEYGNLLRYLYLFDNEVTHLINKRVNKHVNKFV